MALNGRLSIGNIQAFIQYMGQLNQPLVQFGQIANLLQSTVAAAERVFDFLEEKEEKAELDLLENTTSSTLSASSASVLPQSIRGEVEFQHVHFGYEKDKPVIKDFSIHINPGQKVAIV
jgi:ATP-binding cassette subfamily B protein